MWQMVSMVDGSRSCLSFTYSRYCLQIVCRLVFANKVCIDFQLHDIKLTLKVAICNENAFHFLVDIQLDWHRLPVECTATEHKDKKKKKNNKNPNDSVSPLNLFYSLHFRFMCFAVCTNKMEST